METPEQHAISQSHLDHPEKTPEQIAEDAKFVELQALFEAQTMMDKITNSNNYHTKIVEFVDNMRTKYPASMTEDCKLLHLIASSSTRITEQTKLFDLPGGECEEFIRKGYF